MPAQVISFCAVKGGVGKSTIAIAVACEWHRRGVATVLIDVDHKTRSASKFADIRAELGVTDGPPVIAMGANLRTDFERMTKGFDVAIIDCPGELGKRPIAALSLSHLAIMPCGPNGIEVASLAETFEQVQEVQELRPALVGRVLITKKQAGTTASRTAHKYYEDQPFDPLETELFYRLDYGEAHDAGKGPTTWRPSELAALEVFTLVNELERVLGMKVSRRGNLRVI